MRLGMVREGDGTLLKLTVPDFPAGPVLPSQNSLGFSDAKVVDFNVLALFSSRSFCFPDLLGRGAITEV